MADAIKYDYTCIDDAVDALRNVGKNILDAATGLQNNVQSAMADWTGASADQYNQMSNDLKNDIHANIDWLNNAAKTMDDAAEMMRLQDQAGAKGIAAG